VSQPLRVLLVEDDLNDVELVLRELRRAGFDPNFHRVDTEENFIASINPDIELILSDYSMPQFNGLRALKLLQELNLEIPFIIVSGTIGEAVAVDAMRAGANDYLMKGNLARLGPTIVRELQEADNRRARRTAEAALLESEDRYRDLVENSHDLICTHDLSGRILSLNRTAAQVLGYDQENLLNKNIRDVLFPGFEDKFDHYVVALQKTGTAQGVMVVRTKSGEKRLWKYQNTLRTEGVAVPIVRGMAHDVTDQRYAETALRENQTRMAGIVNSAMDAIISVDPEQTIVLFNAAAERIFGCSATEAIGRPIDRFIPKQFADRHKQHIRDFGKTGVTSRTMRSQGALTGLRADGEEFPIEASISQIEVAGQKLFTVILRDVTERKQLEEQFRQSQKMEAIGRLAGGVAHDFNNMLTAIIGYSQIVQAQLDEASPIRRDIKEIENAGHRAAGLTAQLLAFSRKQVLQPKVLDLNEVISSVDNMLRRVIGEDIDLVASTTPGVGHVKADPGQIEQILLNLAVNSRDAMPQGGKLTIETANVELDDVYAGSHADVLPDQYVMLAVGDTGHGLDPETQSHIFEPFFTTKERGKGTGLGLSTVFGIVKQSGGHIWVYSEPGRGATFKIYLPRVDEVPISTRVGATPVMSLRGSETILLVEDDDLVREFARTALQAYGYTVLLAADAASALEQSGQRIGLISLMVTDVVMPRMTGRVLSERLRRSRPEMKVLYMSGYTDDAIVHHGVLDAETDFLQKPFTPVALARKVREVLGD
jgi:two-component system cell cycle sensor histidine kinase/response regulator CckA